MDALKEPTAIASTSNQCASALRVRKMLELELSHDPAVVDEMHTQATDAIGDWETAIAWRKRSSPDDTTLTRLIAQLLNFSIRKPLGTIDVLPEYLELVPIEYSRRHRVLALRDSDDAIHLVTDGSCEPVCVDHLGTLLGRPIVLVITSAADLSRVIGEAYANRAGNVGAIVEGVAVPTNDNGEVALDADADLLGTASRAPVVKLVNTLLSEAIKRRASDVHIQPAVDSAIVRYRIDGVLYDDERLPLTLLDEVVSRVKVIGRMDIAEKRLAQDGRTSVRLGEREIDLRISMIPTCHGERVVIRLLDKSSRLYTLRELGMHDTDRRRFESLIQRSHGIMLVTGPTGSGKSTTLYAALQHLDYTTRNILTLEDPIEYRLTGISQTQVSQKKGMTFATGLRAVLRQDPDVIMVGEIRDLDTARMAIQSSLTGHLVLSTLHTNDAASAVTRLLDLGIEPYLVASTVVAVVAQRLVRVFCSNCIQGDDRFLTGAARKEIGAARKESPLPHGRGTDGRGAVVGNAHPTSGAVRKEEDRSIAVAVRNEGCEYCAGTGFRGRCGIFELLVVDDPIRELIMQREKAGMIKEAAMRAGMSTLRQDGQRMVEAGRTDLTEILKTVSEDLEEERQQATGNRQQATGKPGK